MPAFLPGRELSRRFYEEAVRPLHREFYMGSRHFYPAESPLRRGKFVQEV